MNDLLKEITDLSTNPLDDMQKFWQQVAAHEPEHGALMTLATSEGNKPAARTVLLKKVDENGLQFFTNHSSRKGKQLKKNPWAAAVLYWPSIDLQIAVEGSVQKLADNESDAYFASRPRERQIGAWASRQSQSIADRAALEAAFADVEKKFAGQTIPRPPFWGGFVLSPLEVQFTARREGRLHDRYRVWRESLSTPWQKERLCP